MSSLEQALALLHDALSAQGIPYMVIGGLANARWGVPRATLDVDVTVHVEEGGIPRVVGDLARRFACPVEDGVTFVARTRVLPLVISETKVDLIFSLLPYEREAIGRAIPYEVLGRPIPFCAAEDLVLHKIISTRPKDSEDVQGVLKSQRGKMDLQYLEPRVRQLSELLERPEIWNNYRAWK